MNRGGDFSTLNKRTHFVESVDGRGGFCWLICWAVLLHALQAGFHLGQAAQHVGRAVQPFREDIIPLLGVSPCNCAIAFKL